MALPPTALDALEAAVHARPANTALRVHLAGALLEAGRIAEAAVHCEHVLTSDAANPDALVLGERANRLLGNTGRADELQAVRASLAPVGDGDEPPRTRVRRFRRRPTPL